MILEGLVTTSNEDGSPHLAPMGPTVDRAVRQLTLRPFRSSQTYRNLARTSAGVFHVTDDVELLARAAIDRVSPFPPVQRAACLDGWILADACRWYAFRTGADRGDAQRATFACEIVDSGQLREFFGFNRAKHAVVEAAILATRLHLLPREQVLHEFQRLEVLVQKTAGDQEQRAFDLLQQFVKSEE